MKVKIIEEHNQIISYIKEASQKSKNNFIFINVDSHSDLGMCNPDDEPDIGSFISYLVYHNFLKKYLWIKNNKNINEFQDGNYQCGFWLEDDNKLVCDLNNKLSYIGGVYSQNKQSKNTNNFLFEVVSENKLHKFKSSQDQWFLSIDCDYFGCANPFRDVFDKIKNNIDGEVLNKIIKKYREIENEKDFLSFMCYLSRLQKIDIFYEITQCCYDEIFFSEGEILKKIDLIINFLKTNFDKKKCLGIVLCKSETSGYVIKESLPFILKNLTDAFEEYIK